MFLGPQAPMSNTASSQSEQQDSSQPAGGQQEAEQAGTVLGIQNLQTKGGGEESVRPAADGAQSYAQLSQQV